MTYIPLHKKYRPQVFEDIVGQEVSASILQKSIYSGKIANAYLFAGKHGSGKTSMARIVSKALNCKNPVKNNPCNKCNICNMITADKFPDVIELDAGSNSGVDAARELADNSNYGSQYGGYKVYIIDECHNMSKKAWDSLLKTIEEPNSKTVFIFCTTEYYKVPETIKSRSQIYIFKNISSKSIAKRLKFVSDKENLDVSDKDINDIAEKSRGSMRDALNLLEQVVISDDANKEILLGRISKRDVETFIDLLLNLKYKESVEFIEKLQYPVEDFINELSSYICKMFAEPSGITGKFKIISSDSWIELLNWVTEWNTKYSKTIAKTALNELIILRMVHIIKSDKKTVDKVDNFYEHVSRISNIIGGYKKKIDNDYYVLTSKKGNKLHIVKDVSKVKFGYYCIYPNDTEIFINSNKTVKELIKDKVVKEKIL